MATNENVNVNININADEAGNDLKNFNNTLKQTNEATDKNTKETKENTKAKEKNTKETKQNADAQSKNSKALSGLKDMSAGMVAGYTAMLAAMAGVIAYGKQTIDMFLKQEDATDMVSDAFGSYAGVINDAAEANQKITKIGNEQYQNLAVQAKNFGIANEDVNETVKNSIALADLYGAAGANEEIMLNALIDAQNGKTKGLEAYVKELRGVTDEEERARILNEKIAQGWLQASTAGATYGDQIEMIKNAYGDMQEKIGGQILSGLFGDPTEMSVAREAVEEFIEVLDKTQIISKYIGMLRDQAMMMIEPFENLFKLIGDGGDAADGMTKALDGFFFIVNALNTPVKLFWSLLNSLVNMFINVVEFYKDIENANMQDVWNILNKAITDLLEPITDLLGIGPEVDKMFGIQRESIKLTADEYNKLNVISGNYVENLKKQVKETIKLNEEEQKKIDEAKKRQDEQDKQDKKREDAIKAAENAYKTYTDAIFNANQEFELGLSNGEDELVLLAEKQKALYDAELAYAKFSKGYSDAEKEKLKSLKQDYEATEKIIKDREEKEKESLDNIEKYKDEVNKKRAEKQKEIEENRKNAEAYRKEIGLIAEQTELDELKIALDNKWITQKEYLDKVAEYNKEKADERLELQKETDAKELEANKQQLNMLGGLVQSAMDLELNAAEGNEKKQKEIRKKYALFQAGLSMSQVAINTAEGITKATAQTGVLAPLAVPLVIASGIAQVAAIVQQTNKIFKMAKGGILRGPSHANGGIRVGNVEFEGDEAVINKNSMANPVAANLASVANMIGGGVPLTNNTTSIIDYKLLASEIGRVVNDKQVYVVEGDITKTQKKVSVIERKNKF